MTGGVSFVLRGWLRLTRPPAARIQEVKAVCRDLVVRPMSDAVVVEGLCEVTVVYADAGGTLHGRSCEQLFRRDLRVPGDGLCAGGVTVRTIAYDLKHLPGRGFGEEIEFEVEAEVDLPEIKGDAAGQNDAVGGPGMETRLLRVAEVVGEHGHGFLEEQTVHLDLPAVKVIDVHGQITGVAAEVLDGSVIVQGRIAQQVYFLAEDGLIHYQHDEFPFERAVEIPAAPSMDAQVHGRIRHIEYEVGRDGCSLTEKLLLWVDVKVMEGVEIEVITGLGDAGGTDISRDLVKVDQVVGHCETSHLTESRVGLAAPAERITRVVATAGKAVGQVLDGQVIAEGVVHKRVFYVDREGIEYHQSEEADFSCCLDLAQARLGMQAQVDVRVEALTYDLESGNVVSQSVALKVTARVTETVSLQVVTMAAGPGLRSETREFKMERLVGHTGVQGMIEKRAILVSRTLRIVDIVSTIHELSWEIIPDQVIVQGYVRQQVFFIDKNKIERHQTEDVPFSFLVEVPGALPGMAAMVQPRVKHVSHSLAPERNAFIEKVIMDVEVKVTEAVRLAVVTAIERIERTGPREEALAPQRFTLSGRLELGRPGAEGVVNARAVASAERANTGPDGTDAVRGRLFLEVYYLGPKGAVRYRAEEFPFRQPVPPLPDGGSRLIVDVREVRCRPVADRRRFARALSWEALCDLRFDRGR